jgi:hypothetical protein
MKPIFFGTILALALFVCLRSHADDGLVGVIYNANETNPCQVVYTMAGQQCTNIIDLNDNLHVIFDQLYIADEGSNFLQVIHATWVEPGTNMFPKTFDGTISLDAYSNTNQSPELRIGGGNWVINYDHSKHTTNTVYSEVARSRLDTTRSIYFCKFYLWVPLTRPLADYDTPPENIHIWMTDHTVLYELSENKDAWIIPKETNDTTQITMVSTKSNSPDGDETKILIEHSVPQAIANNLNQSNTIDLTPKPNLGIVLGRSNIFITSSPIMTNGILEESDPSESPLIWHPAFTNSNFPNGWTLPIKPGAKLFRLKTSN